MREITDGTKGHLVTLAIELENAKRHALALSHAAVSLPPHVRTRFANMAERLAAEVEIARVLVKHYATDPSQVALEFPPGISLGTIGCGGSDAGGS